MVVQPPDYEWKCEECGKTISDYEAQASRSFPPKCSKCGKEMEGNPLIHDGPGEGPEILY